MGGRKYILWMLYYRVSAVCLCKLIMRKRIVMNKILSILKQLCGEILSRVLSSIVMGVLPYEKLSIVEILSPYIEIVISYVITKISGYLRPKAKRGKRKIERQSRRKDKTAKKSRRKGKRKRK